MKIADTVRSSLFDTSIQIPLHLMGPSIDSFYFISSSYSYSSSSSSYYYYILFIFLLFHAICPMVMMKMISQVHSGMSGFLIIYNFITAIILPEHSLNSYLYYLFYQTIFHHVCLVSVIFHVIQGQ